MVIDEIKDLNIKTVEFKPVKNGNYEIIFAHKIEDPKLKPNNGHYLSIDLGVSNMMTCFDSANQNSFIVSGREWSTINRYFDKTIAHYASISDAQQAAAGIKYPKQSNRVSQLYEKRGKQLNHLLHSATKTVANYCVKNDITIVVLGDLTNIRKNANHGKRNNQKLHRLPFKRIEFLLEYKLRLAGISLKKQNEAYTSQCSPLVPEVSRKYAKKSNRKQRGLYVDQKQIFNADSVGAFNILRLYFQANDICSKIKAVGLSNPTTYHFQPTKKYLCNA